MVKIGATFIVVIVLLINEVSGFLPSVKYISASRLQSLKAQTDWYSEKFPKDEIQSMWKSSGAPRKAFGEKGQGRALLTIGAKGIGPNTLNSITELLKQHETVRVKVASDAIDTMALSEEIMNSSELTNKAQLLAVKNREFMLGRS